VFHVVLHQPEIPPNTGNIGRLCHATETFLHLVEPLGFDIQDRGLKRAGLDYWKELDPHVWPDLESCLASAPPEAGTYYLSAHGGRPYWSAAFRPGDRLVFGPETRGLPRSLLAAHPERCLCIPQRRGRSLNLATSVGIVLYEAIRQQEAGVPISTPGDAGSRP